jgi:hypothetical protein
MSAMRPDGSAGHEWEAEQWPHCGSVPDVVNVTNHLWRVSLASSANPLEWFPSDTPVLPYQAPPSSVLGSVPRGSIGVGPSRVGAPASSD